MWDRRLRSCCRGTLLLLALLAITTAAQSQTLSVLYNFGSNTGDPINPQYDGVIAQGRDGNLYSTTATGGGANNFGTMFQITSGGTLTVPYTFGCCSLGIEPQSGLTLGADGNFYGTTPSGGTVGFGTVFKITPAGTLTVLYNFSSTDGSTPYAPPIQGTDGNFYGTTLAGGANGLGTVYKLTPSGTLTTLYSFDAAHGYNAVAPLLQGTDGNFYGTAETGGASGDGLVFRITSTGKLTVLVNFDGTNGMQPLSPLIQGIDGNFYGTTSGALPNNTGVVFRMTSTGKITVLHTMNGTTDGKEPVAGLLQASDGNLYGVNQYGGAADAGTIFRISPKSPFQYNVLYNFDGVTAEFPQVTLVEHTNGIFYGDTQSGGSGTQCGASGCGTFFSLNVGLTPFVKLLPTSGKVTKSIGILGQGLTGTTAVSFNGTAASFHVSSDTFLTATIPAGATTGPVTVTTPSGNLKSNVSFRVTPQILSFSPPSGQVGTPVMINGVSLTQTQKVTFGGVAATSFTVNSDTQVTATVPAGAKTGKIAITTPGGTAQSATSFTVLP